MFYCLVATTSTDAQAILSLFCKNMPKSVFPHYVFFTD